MRSIEQAERLRDQLCSYLEQIKARKDAEGGSATAQFISLNEESAEMFFGLLCEWIETTKDLIAGPITASDVNDTNAARVQTRMKYKFVRVGKGVVVCVPTEEYQLLWAQHQDRLAVSPSPENKRESLSIFLTACAEYPPAVYLDFE